MKRIAMILAACGGGSQGQPPHFAFRNAVVVGTIVGPGGKPMPDVPVVAIDDQDDGRISISLEGPPPTSPSLACGEPRRVRTSVPYQRTIDKVRTS